jgi:hypothetical protein
VRGASPGDAAEVASASLRAGRAALARLAYDEAAALRWRAIATLDALHVAAPEALRSARAARRGRVRRRQRRGVARALRQAVAIAWQLGAPQRLGTWRSTWATSSPA